MYSMIKLWTKISEFPKESWGNEDDHNGEIQTQGHEMSSDPGP